jgi:hypothetical protein
LGVGTIKFLSNSLQEIAQRDSVSVEQLVASAIAEKISILMGDSYLQERAKRGSREKYDAIMAKVPDVEPEWYDRLPTESIPNL